MKEIDDRDAKAKAQAVAHQGELAVAKGDAKEAKAELKSVQGALGKAEDKLKTMKKTLEESKASYNEAKGHSIFIAHPTDTQLHLYSQGSSRRCGSSIEKQRKSF